MAVDCLWRLVADGQLVCTSQDHGHKYGLPVQVDAYAEVGSLLRNRSVTDVELRGETLDLTLEFEGGIQLEVLTDFSGYEPWNLTAPQIHLVAVSGGGGVADFSPST